MRLTLVKKKEESKGIISFFWEANPKFDWKPGQYLYYTVKLSDKDPRGNVRHFTIASSPSEGIIQLTTKISDSLYKQTLNKLEIGSEIEGAGPRGDFVLPEPDSGQDGPNVFLAGGIGITPFRSMAKFATDKKLSIPIHLVYSASTPEELIFKEEFNNWAKENPNLTLSYTITKPNESKTPWSGLTGRINSEMIKNQLEIGHWSLNIPTWWVCGPPAFTEAMQGELQKLNIATEKIEVEQFTGY